MSHASAHAHNHAAEFDAHGHKDHGHVIVNIWTLRIILGALLFFTLATVGAAVAEQWISTTFNVVIPQWLNVFVALSIAVVKTTLVVMFFMQLKYDNPLNTMIFVFTILTVAFFLGFIAIDVGKRQTIDRFKQHYIHEGGALGSGGAVPIPENRKLKAAAEADKSFTYTNMKVDESIVDRARRIARDKAALGLDDHGKSHAGHGHDDHGHGHGQLGSITESGYRRPQPAIGSTGDRSRPVRGVTLPGFADATADPHGHGHGDGHGHEAPVEKPSAH